MGDLAQGHHLDSVGLPGRPRPNAVAGRHRQVTCNQTPAGRIE